MKIESTIRTGFRSDSGAPLIEVGVNDFDVTLGRPLTTQERALVVALAEAKLVTIIEDVAPPPPPKSDTRIIVDRPTVKKRSARVHAHVTESVIQNPTPPDPKHRHGQPRKRVARRA